MLCHIERYVFLVLKIWTLAQKYYGLDSYSIYDDYDYSIPPPHLVPLYKNIYFENKNYKLRISIQSTDKKILFILFTGKNQNTEGNKSLLLGSNDGGNHFQTLNLSLNGESVSINEMVPVKGYLFCYSTLKSTLAYFDKELNGFHIHKYHNDGTLTPHRFYPQYIFQLVPESSRSFVRSLYFSKLYEVFVNY
ncbi:hypothetical protein RF11_05755 [Thelohanellus kitauei]|uniref:Uncharacterized protein n=1 Tax=Thelohanellus kitauei TaxID=669202 RepID=A0A0C2N7J8_THEKT|nr:hypothetical protein RF11_05755 [Thelohanellus kitauei]